MDLAFAAAARSTDRSRKTGAVIVDPGRNDQLVAVGWNQFPPGISDLEPRHQRPAKYKWTEHAERNAIYRAAADGRATKGCTMALSWYPCADCARAIIQAGITDLLAVEPDWRDERWKEDFAVANNMLAEGGVVTYFVAGRHAPRVA